MPVDTRAYVGVRPRYPRSDGLCEVNHSDYLLEPGSNHLVNAFDAGTKLAQGTWGKEGKDDGD